MRMINSKRSDVSKIHGMINDNRYVSEISCKSANSFTKEPRVIYFWNPGFSPLKSNLWGQKVRILWVWGKQNFRIPTQSVSKSSNIHFLDQTTLIESNKLAFSLEYRSKVWLSNWYRLLLVTENGWDVFFFWSSFLGPKNRWYRKKVMRGEKLCETGPQVSKWWTGPRPMFSYTGTGLTWRPSVCVC